MSFPFFNPPQQEPRKSCKTILCNHRPFSLVSVNVIKINWKTTYLSKQSQDYVIDERFEEASMRKVEKGERANKYFIYTQMQLNRKLFAYFPAFKRRWEIAIAMQRKKRNNLDNHAKAYWKFLLLRGKFNQILPAACRFTVGSFHWNEHQNFMFVCRKTFLLPTKLFLNVLSLNSNGFCEDNSWEVQTKWERKHALSSRNKLPSYSALHSNIIEILLWRFTRRRMKGDNTSWIEYLNRPLYSCEQSCRAKNIEEA